MFLANNISIELVARFIIPLILNHKDWTPQQLPIDTYADLHTIATIPPHTIQYNPTPEWPGYYKI